MYNIQRAIKYSLKNTGLEWKITCLITIFSSEEIFGHGDFNIQMLNSSYPRDDSTLL
jgi:hypothetical protein